MARMKIIDEELADNIMYSCSSAGLLYSCAELLRVAPNPRTHPFMEIMEVWIQLMCVCVCTSASNIKVQFHQVCHSTDEFVKLWEHCPTYLPSAYTHACK